MFESFTRRYRRNILYTCSACAGAADAVATTSFTHVSIHKLVDTAAVAVLAHVLDATMLAPFTSTGSQLPTSAASQLPNATNAEASATVQEEDRSLFHHVLRHPFLCPAQFTRPVHSHEFHLSS